MAATVLIGSGRGAPWVGNRRRTSPERALGVSAALGTAVLILHQILSARGVPLLDAVIGIESGDLHGDHSGVGAVLAMQGAMWTAMIAATMLPSIRANVRHVMLRSPRRLRWAAMVQIVGGWAVPWAGAAIIVSGTAWVLVQVAGRLGAVTVAFVLATGWQLTARKRLSLARCHRTTAPPLTRRDARRTCWRFGLGLGRSCALSCWALMLPMALLDHHLLVVAPLTAVSWYERRRPHPQLRQRVTAAAVAAVGLATVALLAVA